MLAILTRDDHVSASLNQLGEEQRQQRFARQSALFKNLPLEAFVPRASRTLVILHFFKCEEIAFGALGVANPPDATLSARGQWLVADVLPLIPSG